jgi:hypothetical protein
MLSKDTTLAELITTQPEKNRIRLSLIVLLNITLVSVAFEPNLLSKFKLYTHDFYWFNNNLGYAACIVLGLSFLLLPMFKILKLNGRIDKTIGHLKNKEILKQEFEIKVFTLHRKITVWFAKLLRKFHIPISLFGIVFVFMHVYFALISGFKWNYTYISGYLALLDILVLSVMGLLRFKKLDKSLHKNLSYVLILLTFLHYLFSELRM